MGFFNDRFYNAFMIIFFIVIGIVFLGFGVGLGYLINWMVG